MGHAHSHERNNMLIAHAGAYHALLTSHLSSSDGNELDIFFETEDDPKPVAFAIVAFNGVITKGGTTQNIKFEQAPTDERPQGEGAKCSHFVAKTPNISAGDIIQVRVTLMIDSASTTVEWNDFDVKKYCHHSD